MVGGAKDGHFYLFEQKKMDKYGNPASVKQLFSGCPENHSRAGQFTWKVFRKRDRRETRRRSRVEQPAIGNRGKGYRLSTAR
jgi:hypothetical protein